MKRAIIILAAVLLTFVAFAFIPETALAYDYGGVTYNDNDYSKLKDFFNQTSADGVQTNGQFMYSGYDPDDPNTWTGVAWDENTSNMRVTEIIFSHAGLAGSLDLSGFTSLTGAYMGTNSLTSLSVAGDTALTEVWCNDNDITTLDASGCTSLTTLWCSNNNISTLTGIGDTALEILYCDHNQLSSLLAMPDSILWLDCTYNQLTLLPEMPDSIVRLDCNNNQLGGTLDLSGLENLSTLFCYNNQLTGLNISGDSKLLELRCKNNQITDIDASGLTNLKWLDCSSNALMSLNVSGDNILFELRCDNNALESLNASGLASLNILYCNSNVLTSLDVTGDSGLILLNCEDNALTTLDVSGLNIRFLMCGGNQLSTLNITGDIMLTQLYCEDNRLTSLDLTESAMVTALETEGNPLKQIDAMLFDLSTVSLTAVGNGYVELAISSDDMAMYATAVAALDGVFVNWTSSGTEAGTTAVYDMILLEHSYNLDANFDPVLTLTGSPADGKIYTGDMVTITPNIAGGTWEFDSSYLSRDGNDFTGLKAGTAAVKYTAGSQTAEFNVTITQKLLLTSSVADGIIYTGGRITLTPSVEGGDWAFDSTFFSRAGSTFTALKAGISTITYTVDGMSVFYEVTIQQSELPPTGQNGTWIYILGAAGLIIMAALGLTRKTAHAK